MRQAVRKCCPLLRWLPKFPVASEGIDACSTLPVPPRLGPGVCSAREKMNTWWGAGREQQGELSGAFSPKFIPGCRLWHHGMGSWGCLKEISVKFQAGEAERCTDPGDAFREVQHHGRVGASRRGRSLPGCGKCAVTVPERGYVRNRCLGAGAGAGAHRDFINYISLPLPLAGTRKRGC